MNGLFDNFSGKYRPLSILINSYNNNKYLSNYYNT